jgi:hypothetical protein
MLPISPGATSQSLIVFIGDNNGLPVTGLNAASFPTLKGLRVGEEETAFPALSDLADQDAAFTAGGVIEYGSGRYRVDPPDSLWATPSRQVEIIGEADNKRVLCPPIRVSGDQIQAWLALNIKTTGGTDVELMAGIEVNGQHVDLETIDPSATCAITAYIKDTDIPVFELDTTDVGAPVATKGIFEAEFPTVNFTADRAHILIATITYLGNAYQAKQPFNPVG